MKHKRSTMGYTVSCVALGVLFLATIVPSNAAGMTSTDGPEKADIIYKGDSHVRLNQPFTISCTIGLADEVEWLKDGFPVPTRLAEEVNESNEEVSYIADETSLNTTVVATLNVRRAKAEHAGLYQCNRYSSRQHKLSMAPPDSVKFVTDFDNYKTYDIKGHIILSCNVTLETEKDVVLEWLKDGTDVRDVESLKDRFKIHSKEHKFTIMKSKELDVGNYTCRINKTAISDTVQVVARPHVKLPPNTGVIEGEKLKITCLVSGLPTPDVEWVIGNETYNVSKDRVELSRENNGTEAVLIIKEAQLTDFGNYICRASNIATHNINATEDATYVRVKDKLAALWPFLGICAEVFILCAIILVYEKRRNKPEMEDSDTEQSPDQKK